jgi:hypothetical protein
MITHANGFFESTVKLFDSYLSKFKETKPNHYPTRWAQEIMKRIKQLSFLYDQIKDYEDKIEVITIKLIQQNPVDYDQFEESKRLFFEEEVCCQRRPETALNPAL